MGAPRRQTLVTKFEKLDKEIQTSFTHFLKLFSEFPTDVSITYLFAQIETSQVNCLYCGVVKLHRANAVLTRQALENWHITRPAFQDKYKLVFGKGFNKSVAERMEHAEKVRDNIVHGKCPKDGAMRQAVFDIFEYSTLFSDQVMDHGGFTPFGSLRGFKGRAKSLDKSTSRWILKGMGFT
mgnify:CR=1 FL=1